jgi:hypothetical protein
MPQSFHGMRRATAPSLGAEPLTSSGASGGHHPAAAFGGHAGAETVTALAHKLARLIGPLHGLVLRSPRGSGSWMKFKRRRRKLIRDPSFGRVAGVFSFAGLYGSPLGASMRALCAGSESNFAPINSALALRRQRR